MHNRKSERGNAMIESAITMPLLLLLMVGIFEVGRAYQTWQVVSNAAREGARMAVIPNSDQTTVRELVREYMSNGQLTEAQTAAVDVNSTATITVNGSNVGASQVTVDYPFQFIVLGPVARLVAPQSTTGDAITMRATSLMRNEAQ